jgi:hypothetical protein
MTRESVDNSAMTAADARRMFSMPRTVRAGWSDAMRGHEALVNEVQA